MGRYLFNRVLVRTCSAVLVVTAVTVLAGAEMKASDTQPARSSGFLLLEQERTLDVHIDWDDYWGTYYHTYDHDEAVDFGPYNNNLELIDNPAYAFASQTSSLGADVISTASYTEAQGEAHNGYYVGDCDSNFAVSFITQGMQELTITGDALIFVSEQGLGGAAIIDISLRDSTDVLFERYFIFDGDQEVIDETVPVESGVEYTIEVLLHAIGDGFTASSSCNLTLTAGSYCVDLTGDNLVNIDDIFAVLGYWGQCADPCPPACPGDINLDCSVNIDDIFALLGQWGECD